METRNDNQILRSAENDVEEPARAAKTTAPRTTRREVIGRAAISTLSVATFSSLTAGMAKAELDPQSGQQRRAASRIRRVTAARSAEDQPHRDHPDNGDEARYASKIGNFSKGLPHNARGEVSFSAYNSLITAIASGQPYDYENIQIGRGRKLTNPQAALAFDSEGPDSHALAIPPAPALASAEAAGEAVELYWLAILRDVPFARFNNDPGVEAAARDLSRLSDFRGPKQNGRVMPSTLFRGLTPGDLSGPFISQFLWQPIPYGALTIEQKMRTVMPGHDYLTNYAAWLDIQNGGPNEPDRYADTPRYILTMRDMGQWVHVDALYEAYLNACLILLGQNAPFDPGNPYIRSRTQIGFGTFGAPHILSLVTEVATRALKAVWFQKWNVHRRLRPEAYGGLVHHAIANRIGYPVHHDVLNSAAVQHVASRFGTYLLPVAFPEGSPSHPAYGAGHATVAGACVTILKAWFDENWVLPNPVAPDEDGDDLVPIQAALTVGGELNKVAANIAIGRNMAGVHWRSDYAQSMLLGEQVAIGVLEEFRFYYNEPFSFTLTKFDGTRITI